VKYTYKTKGVCSSTINFEVEDDVITSLQFVGGCNGNLKGISSLCIGMKVQDVIERLEGIKCGFKSSSCPDQLAEALKEYKAKKAANI
jgi:uncharacterized protein (TIGR03905 family)